MKDKSLQVSAAAAAGPDMVDVSNYAREMLRIHGVDLKFEVRVGPGQYVGCATVTVMISCPVLVGPGEYLKHRITEGFPGHRHKNLEQVMYYLCHRADSWCAEHAWYQSTLFDA